MGWYLVEIFIRAAKKNQFEVFAVVKNFVHSDPRRIKMETCEQYYACCDLPIKLAHIEKIFSLAVLSISLVFNFGLIF